MIMNSDEPLVSRLKMESSRVAGSSSACLQNDRRHLSSRGETVLDQAEVLLLPRKQDDTI